MVFIKLIFNNLDQALYTKLFFLLGILWIIDAVQVVFLWFLVSDWFDFLTLQGITSFLLVIDFQFLIGLIFSLCRASQACSMLAFFSWRKTPPSSSSTSWPRPSTSSGASSCFWSLCVRRACGGRLSFGGKVEEATEDWVGWTVSPAGWPSFPHRASGSTILTWVGSW